MAKSNTEKYIPHLRRDLPEIFGESNEILYNSDIKHRTEHLKKGEDLALLSNGNFVVVKDSYSLENEFN
jgi:hypothetical protein